MSRIVQEETEGWEMMFSVFEFLHMTYIAIVFMESDLYRKLNGFRILNVFICRLFNVFNIKKKVCVSYELLNIIIFQLNDTLFLSVDR